MHLDKVTWKCVRIPGKLRTRQRKDSSAQLPYREYSLSQCTCVSLLVISEQSIPMASMTSDCLVPDGLALLKEGRKDDIFQFRLPVYLHVLNLDPTKPWWYSLPEHSFKKACQFPTRPRTFFDLAIGTTYRF